MFWGKYPRTGPKQPRRIFKIYKEIASRVYFSQNDFNIVVRQIGYCQRSGEMSEKYARLMRESRFSLTFMWPKYRSKFVKCDLKFCQYTSFLKKTWFCRNIWEYRKNCREKKDENGLTIWREYSFIYRLWTWRTFMYNIVNTRYRLNGFQNRIPCLKTS